MKLTRSFWKGLSIGGVTGISVGLVGFFLTVYLRPETPYLGLTVFFMVPFCAGFAIGWVTRKPETRLAATFLAVFIVLAVMIATRLEGWLCVLLALPILAVGLALGAWAAFLLRRFLIQPRLPTNLLLFSALPVLIVGARDFERPRLEDPRRETVTNTIFVAAPAEEVWKKIEVIDHIDGQKPFLMHIGLPVPVRCALEGRGIGAKRTCYFEHGTIEETVTEWNPPHSMRLAIDRTNMPGRHWLGFEDAHYTLQPVGSGTLVTRSTTFTSHLAPVWYWRYFERLGIKSEHAYILEDVARRIGDSPGQKPQ